MEARERSRERKIGSGGERRRSREESRREQARTAEEARVRFACEQMERAGVHMRTRACVLGSGTRASVPFPCKRVRVHVNISEICVRGSAYLRAFAPAVIRSSMNVSLCAPI
eukprot:3910040-Pleurochrysis_carterae.AAC.1